MNATGTTTFTTACLPFHRNNNHDNKALANTAEKSTAGIPEMKKQNLKILQANNYGYTRGGSDVCYLATQQLLQQHGHSVTSFNVSNDTESNKPESQFWPPSIKLANPGIQDITKFLYSPIAKKQLGKLCETFRPDVAHLHIYYGQLTSSILHALRQRSIPIVQTLHEYKLICPVSTLICHGNICTQCHGSQYWHAVTNKCNQGSLSRSALSAAESYLSKALGSWSSINHFIAVSDFLREQMIANGIPAEKITTVHNFIDLNDKQPSTHTGDHFLYLGRLEKIKGVMTLLQAMKNAPGKLLIAGDGPARAEMEDFIIKNDLRNVSMLGFQSGKVLQDLIKTSRCVIAPSEWYETFGLVAIEAFAYARPVIASRIGGLAEIISHQQDGLLFTPGNVDELCQALQWIWENPEKASEMGHNGRKMIEVRFNPEKHYQGLMAVYAKVIGQ